MRVATPAWAGGIPDALVGEELTLQAQLYRHSQRGGLARAVRPEDAEDLAFGYREGHVVDRDQRSVRLAEMRDLDRRPGHDLLRRADLGVLRPSRRAFQYIHDGLLLLN